MQDESKEEKAAKLCLSLEIKKNAVNTGYKEFKDGGTKE